MTAKQRFEAQRASLQHLLDLKHAGHSPRRTELEINRFTDQRPRHDIGRQTAAWRRVRDERRAMLRDFFGVKINGSANAHAEPSGGK